jgi:uncharacterized protein YdeI (YjbR/CyaY-like superfamily)
MSDATSVAPVDLSDALAEADVLHIYSRLPQADRARFARWIGMARDETSHWRRIETLVMAMKLSPLVLSAVRSKVEPQQAMDI